jgi:sigma-E factor negative regulatory protein RseA
MKEFENASWPERLSALVDGEADAAETAQIAGQWRDDPRLRSHWHGYHLIGDVMRSDELTGRAGDAAFLVALRARLAAEPVVLAPTPEVPIRRRAALGWRAPAAVAAGFVMVAGALVVLRPTAPVEAVKLSAAPALQPPTRVAAAAPAAAPPVAAQAPARGVLIRDARMQQYFAAHQQFGGSTALGLPSAFLRNATYDTPSAEAGSR